MSQPPKTKTERVAKSLVEGDDFYFENGLMVFTAKYLRDRGYCCGNICRHCPYSKDEKAVALKKKLL